MAQDTSTPSPESDSADTVKQSANDKTPDNTGSTLVKLGSPPELNRRLEEFEETLKNLDQRLESTRSTYNALNEVSGNRHEEMHDDLGRVQESLTSLQDGYERLSEQTKRIAAETGRLAISVSDSQDASSEDLDKLKSELSGKLDEQAAQALQQREELTTRLTALSERAERLDQQGQDLASRLDKRSQALESRIQETEQALQAQLQKIADETVAKAIGDARQYTDTSIEDQAAALTFEIQQSSQSLRKEQQAAHAQLQDANQGLARRMEEQSTQLDKRIAAESDARRQSEQTQRETNQRLTQAQDEQTTALEAFREATEGDAAQARARTEALEQSSQHQAEEIVGLSKARVEQGVQIDELGQSQKQHGARMDDLNRRLSRETEQLSSRLDVFADLIRTHRRQGMAAFVLLLLVIGGYALFQDRALSEQQTKTDNLLTQTTQQMEDQKLRTHEALFLHTQIQDQAHRRTNALESQVKDLELENQAQKTAQEKLTQQAQALQAQVEQQQQQIAALNDKLVEVKDQSETNTGRVNGMVSVLDHFGGDNILHGPEWLAKQEAKNWAIRLTTTSDRQRLYDLAQRYGNRLPEKLAYYPVTENGQTRYALVYGQYPDFAQATQKMFRAPRINLREPARLERIGDIQAQL